MLLPRSADLTFVPSSVPARTSPLHPHDERGHVVATPHARRSKSDSHHGERLLGSPAYVTPHRYRAGPRHGNALAKLRRACATSIPPPTSRAPSASAGC